MTMAQFLTLLQGEGLDDVRFQVLGDGVLYVRTAS